ncbi:MAG: CPBP family intramembrane metalloprotease [Lentisphaeria bacterium]|nr:CPBP family intramembrane metalloprotease [Lentisphaeria bacterium]
MPPRFWLRIWVLAAIVLFFPSVLIGAGLSPAWAMAATGICGVATAVFPLRSSGIRPLSLRTAFQCAWYTVWLILFSSIAVAAAKLLLRKCGVPFPERQPLAETISGSPVADAVLLFLAVCVLIPFVEEVLFRRLIFRAWHKAHPGSAWLGTSLLFAAVHGYLPGLPGLFILGCGFQYLYLRHRNLAAAILAHSLVNMFAFGISVLIR